MKKWLFILFVITSNLCFGQLFQEDFSGEADGAVSGTAVGGTWSVTTTPSGGAATFSKQTNAFANGIFEANGTGNEGVWTSSSIDISGTGAAVISISLASIFTDATDYVRCSYIVDGGMETQFAELLGQFISVTTAGSAIVSGSTLQLIVRSRENPGGGGYMRFDDVVVTAVTRLYSKKSGNWDDIVDGGDGLTWAINSHVGTDYPFVPTANELIYIGAGHVVNLNVAGTAGGVVIEGTAGSELQYTAGVSLSLSGGVLDVQSGSNGIDRNGQANSSLIFSLAIPVSITVNAPISMDDMQFNAGSAVDITGSSSITLTDDIIFGSSNASIDNSVSLSLDDVLTTNPLFAFTGLSITNNAGSTITLSDFNMNATIGECDLTLSNSGTITQSGTFLNTDAGSSFNNLSGSTWNYSGTGHDTDTRLFASSATNNFNYALAGAQQIITPVGTDGYYNLNLQNSGAKTALGNFSVYGNWNRTGATFVPGGFTVTFSAAAGTAAQSITAAGGETFAGLTINSAFAISPQITLNNTVTVTSVLTMTSGNFNLNGNNLTLSSNASGALVHGLTSISGWMYGGSIIRNRPASTVIAVGAAHSLFPLGSSADWRPFFVGQNNNANSAGNITVSHTNGTNSTTVAFAESVVRRHNSFWTVSTTGISAGPTWTLRAGGTNFGTIEAGAAGLADLRMCTTTGMIGTHGAATGGPDYRVNRTGIVFGAGANGPLANNYHVASTDAVNSPLPIELVSFNASLKSDIVELDWTTASELNNDFFTIERLNEEDDMFDQIATIKGSGTINEARSYQAYDFVPNIGKNYYRLKQTDFDGQFSYSKIVMVDFIETGEIVNIYPNPVNQQTLTIEVKQLKSGQQVPLQIRSMLGVHTFKASYTADSTGSIKVIIPVDQWSQGLYLVQIGTDTPVLRKIVIE
jgi:hypothetical protein